MEVTTPYVMTGRCDLYGPALASVDTYIAGSIPDQRMFSAGSYRIASVRGSRVAMGRCSRTGAADGSMTMDGCPVVPCSGVLLGE